MKIREALAGDIPGLAVLGRRMQAESLVPYPEVDEDLLRERLARVRGYVVFVAEMDDGRMVGMLSAMVASFMFAPASYAIHDIFYVVPECRGSLAAMGLMRAYEKWADDLGLWNGRRVIASHTLVNPDRTHGLYEKMGFKPMGKIYYKDTG